MTETLKLNDGSILDGNALLSGDLFLYVNGSDLQTVFSLLIDPEKTKKIVYTMINETKQTFTGYKRLIAVRDEGNGLITAVLRKEGA
jgi:hypothetical protein